MSRERAQRRAERHARDRAEAAESERREHRARRRTAALRFVRPRAAAPLGRLTRRRTAGRPSSALSRYRHRQNGILLSVLLCAHALLWLVQPSWWWRGGALAATVVLWPVLVVLFFDRRSSE